MSLLAMALAALAELAGEMIVRRIWAWTFGRLGRFVVSRTRGNFNLRSVSAEAFGAGGLSLVFDPHNGTGMTLTTRRLDLLLRRNGHVFAVAHHADSLTRIPPQPRESGIRVTILPLPADFWTQPGDASLDGEFVFSSPFGELTYTVSQAAGTLLTISDARLGEIHASS